MIADAAERVAALSPGQSYIVEAPAGSGKTELLTQRFLTLLAAVELPEQIVAITFTRKAAAEMRQRVIETLRAADAECADIPEHRRASVELARRVLSRSDTLGWSLLEQTQRLRILTIDALNASLARQLPVLTSGVVSAELADDADGLYRLAARRTADALAEPGELGGGLRCLLRAAGNRLVQLETWLAGALPQRDRWLRLFARAGAEGLAETVEAGLRLLADSHVRTLRSLAGPDLERRLTGLLAGRREHLLAADTAAKTGPEAAEPDFSSSDLDFWQDLAALLLTSTGSLRRRFTRREGFPPDDPGLREDLNGVLASVTGTPALFDALTALKRLPESHLDTGHRELLGALEPVLMRLLAELRIVFADSQTVDHTELAIAALQALGAVDAPSDLLLALDRRIEHILVDEFQDTSHLQWGLLEHLTAGWQQGDGRSLFLVGDPMQSIYRFRDADLSLFLRARREGIGNVRLQPLRLSVNFRSEPVLIDWVNSAFAPVFGDKDRLESGTPAFRPAIAGRDATPAAGVTTHDLTGGSYADEITRVVELVRQESSDEPRRSIGILVRSRSHLIGMRAALAAAGVPAHAIEIDSLTDTQLGQDLITLSTALLHEGDRLAWLALLRSPQCGIGWSDLHAFCGDQRDRTIWSMLHDPRRLDRLTADARRRVDWLRERLRLGRSRRGQLTLGRWLRDCWWLIDGPAAVELNADLDMAEQFFRDLDRMARAGDVDDPARLKDWFARPAGGETPAESGIEIMTIHRAKGLEFDTVILPGLGRATRGRESKLLLFHELSVSEDERVSLVAATASGSDGLASYLQSIDRDQEAAERARLLYVAATRARQRLHLVGSLGAGGESPRSGSLLAILWPGIEWQSRSVPGEGGEAADRNAEFDTGDGDSDSEVATELIAVPLRRLAMADDLPLPPLITEGFPASHGARPEFEWVHPASVQVGTLIHRELQRWAVRAAVQGALVEPELNPSRHRRELALLGVEPQDLDAAALRITGALESVWRDPVGRWILEPRKEAWSELRLSVQTAERIEHVQLDRSFVADDGQRWIIDYKTGRHLGADIDQFLQDEVDRYREQLTNYARAIAAIDPRPIRVGLYFPLMARLMDWAPAATELR